MRSLPVAFVVVLATATVAPAQQLAPSEADLTVQSAASAVDVPSPVSSIELAPVPLTPAAFQAEQAAHAALESRTAAQVSAQTVLAVIGAAVVIAALVTLFT